MRCAICENYENRPQHLLDDTHKASLELRFIASMMLKITKQSMEQYLNAHDVGLSWMQFHTLRILLHERCTLSELSRFMLVEPPTLVPIVDALVKKGYVERGQDAQDRRRVPLLITPSGKALIESLAVMRFEDPLYLAMNKLGSAHNTQLLALLRELLAELPEGETLLSEIHNRLHSP